MTKKEIVEKDLKGILMIKTRRKK